MTQLTQQEKEAIEREALCIPPDESLCKNYLSKREGYITAATAYALKAKKLVEALETIKKRCVGKYITASYVKDIIDKALSSYNQPSGE